MRHTSLILATTVLALALSPLPSRAQTNDTSRHNVVPAGVTRGDVTKGSVEMPGDFLSTNPAKPDSLAPVPAWDMDVRAYETRERVAHYVTMFTGRARERITDRLERGTRYEPMIRASLRAGGLPEDLYYLALVESGFDPNAYSRAAAVGMWQFMTSTARGMGMRVDGWVDERRDPVKSTTAAVRFIRGLRDQFGSLYLAAAAYNGGPGRVARGIARYADDVNGVDVEDAFFVLADKDYLRAETRDYVPQLIAAALIAKEPARYGMELHVRPPFQYDSVSVPASTPLAAVARAAGVETAAITELNPHLFRGMTPPKSTTLVRLPPGTASQFDSAFDALPRDARVATRDVETKKGDTPRRVADRHGIPVWAVRAFNPGMRVLKSGRLPAGQRLLVPTAAVVEAARDVPDPSIERHAKSARHVRAHKAKAHKSSTRRKKTPPATKKARDGGRRTTGSPKG